jgi:hypothetical protein
MATSTVVGPSEFWNKLDPQYQEIRRLASLLRERHVPHVLKLIRGYHDNRLGGQILYFGDEDPSATHSPPEPVASIIETPYSSGSEQDLLEMMGLLTPEELHMDDILENLTAQQCLARIWEHWSQEV